MGADHIYAAPRGTFGFLELFDGMPLIPALIGLFALSEAFVMIEQETVVSREGVARAKEATWADAWDGLRLAMKHWWETIWTALVGLVIGVTPRSEEHTSELQSLMRISYAVFCLKNNKKQMST